MSVETVIILPILCFVYIAGVVWFDAFRTQYTNLSAIYAISDMVSREQNGIDQDYFEGLHSVYQFLTNGAHPTQLRLSIVECTKDCTSSDSRELAVCWSTGTAGRPPLEDTDIAKMEDRIPYFAKGDQTIVTETFMAYTPLFNIGMGPRVFKNEIFTRPRGVTGQIKWDKGDGSFDDCFNND
ncbi:TadE/TadG family type IV pilus assembly protein [Tropicimonas isoalkanivorans]|uniref:TadE/TadG family type IV pilus assembly protein n=1 Tax=Tropicimonas isoalkanivorans TaxID=441112 RepID=UPI001160BDCE|nr:hypothetical protein [Tropicimonas isoalkanivorans]